MSYINYKINVSEAQRDKIRNAIEDGDDRITIRLGYEDLSGSDIVALTKTQVNAIAKAKAKNKGLTIAMSPSQLRANKRVEGGFLGALMGLATRFLPSILGSLGLGALSGAASAGVQKAIGSGLYLKKGGCICSVQTDGSGLYLKQASGAGLKRYGDGLYLRKANQYYDGNGLILGPNSPFKNIPILGAIL